MLFYELLSIGNSFTYDASEPYLTELVDTMYSAGISNVQRDPAHVSLGIGRYALGLLWYSVLTGRDISKIDFHEFDEAVVEEEIQTVKNCVSKTLAKYINI